MSITLPSTADEAKATLQRYGALLCDQFRSLSSQQQVISVVVVFFALTSPLAWYAALCALSVAVGYVLAQDTNSPSNSNERIADEARRRTGVVSQSSSSSSSSLSENSQQKKQSNKSKKREEVTLHVDAELMPVLSRLVVYTLRDFVHYWFDPLNVTGNDEFTSSMRSSMVHFLNQLFALLLNDPAELAVVLSMAASNTLVVHLRESRPYESSGMSLDEFVRSAPESPLAELVDLKKQREQLRRISGMLVDRLAPKDDANNEAISAFLVEIFATSILEPTIESMCSPDTINENIIAMATVLSEVQYSSSDSTANNSSETPKKPKKGKLATSIDSVLDATRLQEQNEMAQKPIRNVSPTKLRNRPPSVSSAMQQRQYPTGGSPQPTTQQQSLPADILTVPARSFVDYSELVKRHPLSLDDVLTAKSCFVEFMQHLEDINAPAYLRFWNNVETFRRFASTLNDPALMRVDAWSIFHTHFVPVSSAVKYKAADLTHPIPLNDAVLRRIERAINANPNPGVFEEAQTEVRIALAPLFSEFKRSSPLFKEWLREQAETARVLAETTSSNEQSSQHVQIGRQYHEFKSFSAISTPTDAVFNVASPEASKRLTADRPPNDRRLMRIKRSNSDADLKLNPGALPSISMMALQEQLLNQSTPALFSSEILETRRSTSAASISSTTSQSSSTATPATPAAAAAAAAATSRINHFVTALVQVREQLMLIEGKLDEAGRKDTATIKQLRRTKQELEEQAAQLTAMVQDAVAEEERASASGSGSGGSPALRAVSGRASIDQFDRASVSSTSSVSSLSSVLPASQSAAPQFNLEAVTVRVHLDDSADHVPVNAGAARKMFSALTTAGASSVGMGSMVAGGLGSDKSLMFLIELEQPAIGNNPQRGWMITRSYADFVQFHQLLRKQFYKADHIKLPSRISSMSDSSTSTGGITGAPPGLVNFGTAILAPTAMAKHRRKQLGVELERYLSQILADELLRESRATLEFMKPNHMTLPPATIGASIGSAFKAVSGAVSTSNNAITSVFKSAGSALRKLGNDEDDVEFIPTAELAPSAATVQRTSSAAVTLANKFPLFMHQPALQSNQQQPLSSRPPQLPRRHTAVTQSPVARAATLAVSNGNAIKQATQSDTRRSSVDVNAIRESISKPTVKSTSNVTPAQPAPILPQRLQPPHHHHHHGHPSHPSQRTSRRIDRLDPIDDHFEPSSNVTAAKTQHVKLEDLHLLIDTSFVVLDEVFDLTDTSQWLRRKALLVVKQLLRQQYIDRVEKAFLDTVASVSSPSALAQQVQAVMDSMWPNGIWYSSVPGYIAPTSTSHAQTAEERAGKRLEAAMVFASKFLPDAIKKMVGEYNAAMGMTRVFRLMQHRMLTRGIAIRLLDQFVTLLLAQDVSQSRKQLTKSR
ncbi:hypothetical protein GQ42DRAFT_55620 [Ramicandelaber brevisporus]|nr:hypothetical protein GQ42DRAFT_55620 [Ramicandelaber brevisporus]